MSDFVAHAMNMNENIPQKHPAKWILGRKHFSFLLKVVYMVQSLHCCIFAHQPFCFQSSFGSCFFCFVYTFSYSY